jgi:lysylphosphatidylglycerol synthetase-like protein (DUF2156 family)
VKTFLLIVMVVHGLIHLPGFLKAFGLAAPPGLTRPVSRPAGIVWLAASALFLVAAGLWTLGAVAWWIAALPALLISQVLIIRSWSDAKFGSMANLLLMLPVVLSVAQSLPSGFQNRYREEVERTLAPAPHPPVLTDQDIRCLPVPVQRYLRYTGAVGRPRVVNFRAVSRGEMRLSVESSWIDISSRQYNFFDGPARVFYIESALFGIPLEGLHLYIGGKATMQISLAALFPVADARGDTMTKGETVTLFNDMCLLAPSTLIDTAIVWRTLDSLTAEATYRNAGYAITARLSFNGDGKLTDFLSNDRFMTADGKTYERYPWSTPVSEYRDFQGRKVASHGDAVWHMSGGDYTYARFDLQDIEYNCTGYR